MSLSITINEYILGIISTVSGLIITFLFISFFGFVKDTIAKDTRPEPYFRCECCGRIRSEKTDLEQWNNHKICSSCNEDTTEQKEYAVKQLMLLKKNLPP